MVIKTDDKQSNISIESHKIETVNNFTYLGHEISNSNDHETANNKRIGLAWSAFHKLDKIFSSKRVSIHIKAKVYKVYIQPIVLYGCECITWSQKNLTKIEVFHNNVMRFITNVRLLDKISIEELKKAN